MNEQMDELYQALVILDKYYIFKSDVLNNYKGISSIEEFSRNRCYVQMLMSGVDEELAYEKCNDECETVDNINTFKIQYLCEQYRNNDELKTQIDEANKLAVDMTQQNDAIRNMFEQEIKVAFEQQKESQQALITQYNVSIEAKSQAYNEIKERYTEAKEQVGQYVDKNHILEKEINELKGKLQSAEKPNAGIYQESHTTEVKSKGKKLFWNQTKKNKSETSEYIYKRFVEEIVTNNKFSDEQKRYLCKCMEDGLPYSQIKRFAKPEISVELMQMLRNYYDNNIV